MVARDHKEEMIALRKAGKKYREIADTFGVSKQRVYEIIRDTCGYDDRTRKYTVDIENIAYEGIYELFVNDRKMTITKLTRIIFDLKKPNNSHKERVRRLIFNLGEPKLTIRNIRNICDYTGKPFEYLFKVRK